VKPLLPFSLNGCQQAIFISKQIKNGEIVQYLGKILRSIGK